MTMIIQALYTILVFFLLVNGRMMMFGNLVIEPILLLALAALFTAIGLIQFFWEPRGQSDFALALVVYYLATSTFSLLITGDIMLTQMLWVVLLITTGILFSYRALTVGSLIFLIITCAQVFVVSQTINIWYFVLHEVYALMMIALAFYITHLRNTGIVSFDVYEKLKYKEKLQSQRLETVINSIDDAIINVSARGHLRFYNAATLNLLDTNINLNDKEIDDLFNLSNEQGEKFKFSQLLAETANFTLERDDLIHTYKDGQKINLHLAISRVRSSFGSTAKTNLGGFIVIARDITKRKSLEDERDEFIAVVSHELRTPVAIVEGALSNSLFAVEKGADTSMIKSALSDAHDQAMYLAKMVNDLSALSRAQRGINMESEAINVKEFMQDLYNNYSNQAAQANLQLNLDSQTNATIEVSHVALEEIMQNLITNAIKYTKEGTVTIGTKSKPEGVEFYVKDTGIGLSKSDQAHIFQRFWRSEDYRTRETNGTGLGLHVVEQLACKIGTEIKLESRLNHGSTFYFTVSTQKTNND